MRNTCPDFVGRVGVTAVLSFSATFGGSSGGIGLFGDAGQAQNNVHMASRQENVVNLAMPFISSLGDCFIGQSL